MRRNRRRVLGRLRRAVTLGLRSRRAQATAAFLALTGCPHADCDDELPAEHLATGFRAPCRPIKGDAGKCCSDDPAALDGLLPSYESTQAQAGQDGEPLFSAARGRWSEFGQCMLDDYSPRQSSLGGCPIPCNPTWDSVSVEAVCGPAKRCCATLPTQNEDCVLRDGVWRAVRGSDVASPNEWIVAEPGTRQDPDLLGCMDYARMSSGGVNDATLRRCVATLSAADQRGYCIDAAFGCPSDDPNMLPEVDVCAARNR